MSHIKATSFALLASVSLGGLGSAAASNNTQTAASSTQSPYVVPARPNVFTRSLITVGDSVNTKPDGVTPYRMVGIPGGMGAFDNGDGTFTLVMNHEIAVNLLGSTAVPLGTARAHGNAGAFVSLWTVSKSDLEVLHGEDLLRDTTSIFLSNNDPAAGVPHSGYLPGDTTVIARLCSADLGAPSAYAWIDPSTGTLYGTTARIFQSGEESGGIATSITAGGDLGPEGRVDFGRQWNFILTDDPNIPGDESRTAYEMPSCGLFAWENNVANPFSQLATIVVGMDDTSPGGQVYVWVGHKQTTGNVVERAGLTRQSDNDNLYVVHVSGLVPDATGATNEDRNVPLNNTFTLENEGDVSGLTAAQLEALSNSKGATKFLRPEDGCWDPSNPSDYYFVTTDRYDQVKDGVGTQVGRSRLYRLRFSDLANQQLGGTITCLLDGTEAGNMFDNMTINRNGSVFLQEDVGNQAHNGKVFRYGIAQDTLELIAQHDPSRFGDIGLAATAPYNQDEESSGIISVEDILGDGWYLLDVQAHHSLGGELVEGGQLLSQHFAPGQEGKAGKKK
jgi:Alkaline phosphatase PhoX